jgi:hypothetical protein
MRLVCIGDNEWEEIRTGVKLVYFMIFGGGGGGGLLVLLTRDVRVAWEVSDALEDIYKRLNMSSKQLDKGWLLTHNGSVIRIAFGTSLLLDR